MGYLRHRSFIARTYHSADIAEQNLSFILEGIHQVKFEDRPIPELKDPHDVLINVKYTGICGSDVRGPPAHAERRWREGMLTRGTFP